jgi:uncharacterized membrane protein YdfJ with MMPL/SSD domain
MMDKIRKYADYAVERAVKTVAQTAIAVITASAALSLIDVDFAQVIGVAGLAGVMSLLTSVLTYDKAE